MLRPAQDDLTKADNRLRPHHPCQTARVTVLDGWRIVVAPGSATPELAIMAQGGLGAGPVAGTPGGRACPAGPGSAACCRADPQPVAVRTM